MKKKVLFIITKSNWGGAQRYVYDIVTNLDKTAYEPVVALGGDGVLITMLEHAGVRVIPLDTLKNSAGLKNVITNTKHLFHIIKNEKPDIVHLNSSVAGFLGALAGRLARVPRIIFTAHGWAFNEDRPWWQRLIIKSFHYLTVLMSHKTIAVSRAIVTQMNWPKAPSKMMVINPGRTIGVMYSREEARVHLTEMFPAITPYYKDTWLLCIAELHPIKRHTVLFDAVRRLTAVYPTIRLMCIGDGKEEAKLKSWITRHGMEEHIFLLGSIHEAARYLKAADIFVLASTSESYGYVIHEAGLAHVPVVATNVGGIPDIVKHEEEGILVMPNSPTALAAGITTSLSDTPGTIERSKRLYDTLSSRTTKSMVTTTAKLYE